MWVRVTDRRPFFGVLVGLIALAWLALAGWGLSPYGRLLDHAALDEQVGGGSSLLLITVGGWTLMTVAMMLPTSLPLITLFAGFVRQRAGAAWLVGLLVAGYLAVWALFGLLVHLVDLSLHLAMAQLTLLAATAPLLGGATLLVAGAYQFSSLKYHCLEKCRSPLSFIMQHWRGRQERLRSFALGVHHGLFCLGCCWALMLLMFAVGVGNLAWMLLLGMVMAAEKNLPGGRRLSKPLGAVLLAAGLVLIIRAWVA